ncbi:hypothetical protein N0F11_26020 (plasmid) [Escherichia coli]|nr:hypothetical protein [Escherichia coli]WAT37011.1 hypothetical protein N0F11_26020 [Escherichia coli]
MNTAIQNHMAANLFLAVLYHFWRHRRAGKRGCMKGEVEERGNDFQR